MPLEGPEGVKYYMGPLGENLGLKSKCHEEQTIILHREEKRLLRNGQSLTPFREKEHSPISIATQSVTSWGHRLGHHIPKAWLRASHECGLTDLWLHGQI